MVSRCFAVCFAILLFPLVSNAATSSGIDTLTGDIPFAINGTQVMDMTPNGLALPGNGCNPNVRLYMASSQIWDGCDGNMHLYPGGGSGNSMYFHGNLIVDNGWSPDQSVSINSNQIWKSGTAGDSTLYVQWSAINGSVVIGGQTANSNNSLYVKGDIYLGNGWHNGNRLVFGEDGSQTITYNSWNDGPFINGWGGIALAHQGSADLYTNGGNVYIPNRIGVLGRNPNDIPGGWGGGVRTFDLVADGTVAIGNSGGVRTYMNGSGIGFPDGTFQTTAAGSPTTTTVATGICGPGSGGTATCPNGYVVTGCGYNLWSWGSSGENAPDTLTPQGNGCYMYIGGSGHYCANVTAICLK